MKKLLIVSVFVLIMLMGCASLINPEVSGIEKNGRSVFMKEFRKDIDACREEWVSNQAGVTMVGGRLALVENPELFKEEARKGIWKCLWEQKGYKAKK